MLDEVVALRVEHTAAKTVPQLILLKHLPEQLSIQRIANVEDFLPPIALVLVCPLPL